jgi:hypothetical protein
MVFIQSAVLCSNNTFKYRRLAVSAEDLEPFLEGLTLQDALDKNKIFIVDLELLNRAPCKNEVPVVRQRNVILFQSIKSNFP